MASLIFSFLASLPLGTLQKLGVFAGWVTYALSPTYRRRLRANLEHALGKAEAELVAKVVRVSGWEHVEAAEARGGGILFITPHLGCFEITAQYFSTHRPITVLYRPPKKAVLQPLIDAC